MLDPAALGIGQHIHREEVPQATTSSVGPSASFLALKARQGLPCTAECREEMSPSQWLSHSRDFNLCHQTGMICSLTTWHCRDLPPFCLGAWHRCCKPPVISCCLSAQGHSSPTAASSARRVSLPARAEPCSVGAELIECRPYFIESIRNNLILGCGNWQPPQLLSQLLGLIIRPGPMLLFLTCSIYLPGSVRCCSAGAGCAAGLESGGYSCPNHGSQDGSVIRAGYSCFF